ncbi:MAG: hypothetical protein IJT97_10415 [Bacteroidaceae bacterium]|nr:hypothetical protein [Bacteroidaceae bacterium]
MYELLLFLQNFFSLFLVFYGFFLLLQDILRTSWTERIQNLSLACVVIIKFKECSINGTKVSDVHGIKPEKVPSGLDRGSQPYSRAVGTAKWLGMKEQGNKRAFRYAIIAYLTAG